MKILNLSLLYRLVFWCFISVYLCICLLLLALVDISLQHQLSTYEAKWVQDPSLAVVVLDLDLVFLPRKTVWSWTCIQTVLNMYSNLINIFESVSWSPRYLNIKSNGAWIRIKSQFCCILLSRSTGWNHRISHKSNLLCKSLNNNKKHVLIYNCLLCRIE